MTYSNRNIDNDETVMRDSEKNHNVDQRDAASDGIDITNELYFFEKEVPTVDEQDHNVQEQTSEDEDLAENFPKHYDYSIQHHCIHRDG
ncbi:unnamed protein product, partial [Didymodactylos carnosus]